MALDFVHNIIANFQHLHSAPSDWWNIRGVERCILYITALTVSCDDVLYFAVL